MDNILTLKSVHKKFNLEAGLFAAYGRFVYAVNGIDMTIRKGETYGLVGESGCGKTTLARLICGMYSMERGHIYLEEPEGLQEISRLGRAKRKVVRDRIKYVFQDPAKSLNPRLNILQILTSGYRYSPSWPGKKEARRQAEQLMEDVGLSPEDLERRPAEFSGGQRQRISIARALITRPEILVCDEVVSALDVSIQSQILNLLLDLKEKYNLTILFIAHDLTVTSFFCDRIGVMYRGMIMEEAPATVMLEKRVHPYTQLLYDSIPERMGEAQLRTKPAEPAHNDRPLEGCPFYHRCMYRRSECTTLDIELKELTDEQNKGHMSACPFTIKGEPLTL